MESTTVYGRRARTGAGWTLPAAAAKLKVPYKTMLKAADRGEVKVIDFGGTKRVPDAELGRLATLFASDGEAV